MKRQIIFFLLLLHFVVLFGEPVTKEAIQTTVKTFVENYFPKDKKYNIREIIPITSSGVTTMYIINFDPEGWILIAADDKIDPILGFNFKGAFNLDYNSSPLIDEWMNKYFENIVSAKDNLSLKRNQLWNGYYGLKSTNLVNVEPLINVTWDQDAPFNQFCPESSSGPGGHVYVGCVAVAMAQAMSVYKFPTLGIGTKTYTENDYGKISLQFDQVPLKWDSMSNTSGDKFNAWLLYNCAVSVGMDFSPDGSGAYTFRIPNALRTYFKYHNGVKSITRSGTVNDWIQILVGELAEGRPIIYGGDAQDNEPGHAFNIDGVIDSKYFHLNWGWSGFFNGYYTITNLTPGGFDFTKDHDAIISIRPTIYCPTDVFLSDNKIKEGLPVGSFVGKISITDEAIDNIYSLTLLGDSIAPNTYLPPDFYLSHDTIMTSRPFNLSEESSFNIFVQVKDQFDHFLKKKFTIYIISNPYTSIDNTTAEGLKLYPNPTTDGHFFIYIPSSFNSYYTVNLFDLSGHKVFTSSERSVNSEISINYPYPGIYILEFFNSSGITFHKKIWIQ